MEVRMTNDELITHIRVLEAEIKVQKSRIEPHDTGHIHTTIGVLEDRVEELLVEVKNGPVPGTVRAGTWVPDMPM